MERGGSSKPHGSPQPTRARGLAEAADDVEVTRGGPEAAEPVTPKGSS